MKIYATVEFQRNITAHGGYTQPPDAYNLAGSKMGLIHT